MLKFSEMEKKLQSALSIKRYIHTIGVVKEAEKLALHYGEDKNRARTAALLHDCAKDYPEPMMRRFCKEFHVPLDNVMDENIELAHSFLGAEVARREYLVEDEGILNAIRYHTTGKENMTLLEKIIFIADYIEPGRKKFDTLDEARRLAYTDIDKAMAFILKHTIEYVKSNGRPLHPLSEEALKFYS